MPLDLGQAKNRTRTQREWAGDGEGVAGDQVAGWRREGRADAAQEVDQGANFQVMEFVFCYGNDSCRHRWAAFGVRDKCACAYVLGLSVCVCPQFLCGSPTPV